MTEGGTGNVEAVAEGTPIGVAVVAGEVGDFWWTATGGSYSQSPVVEVWAAEGSFLPSPSVT